MGDSTIPEVKQALVTLYDGSATLDGWQVSYGFPRGLLERDTVIVASSAPDGEQEWAALGARKRDERYEIEHFITASKPGRTQKEATERAFAGLSACEALLRANVTLGLGGQGVIEVQISDVDFTEFHDKNVEGFGCQIKWGVRVHARI